MEKYWDEHELPKREFYFVEKILDSKIISGNKYYYIKWLGELKSESTWEPAEHLVNVQNIVDEFEANRKILTKARNGNNSAFKVISEVPKIK